MSNIDQGRAATQIDLLAARNSWPLISDANLNFVTPQLKIALETWVSKRGVRTMPSRGDFALRDLKLSLPNLAFLSIVREGTRTRLKAKLVGTELDRFMGGPMTGRFVDEAIPARFAEKWLALWMPAIDDRVPTRTVGRVEFADKKYYVSETLHAPLADDGEAPDTLMLVAYFYFTGDARDVVSARLLGEIGERATCADRAGIQSSDMRSPLPGSRLTA